MYHFHVQSVRILLYISGYQYLCVLWEHCSAARIEAFCRNSKFRKKMLWTFYGATKKLHKHQDTVQNSVSDQ
jgi:hypothetical protein